jgi:hypothetical protein
MRFLVQNFENNNLKKNTPISSGSASKSSQRKCREQYFCRAQNLSRPQNFSRPQNVITYRVPVPFSSVVNLYAYSATRNTSTNPRTKYRCCTVLYSKILHSIMC